MGSSFTHLIRTDSNEFFLMAEEYSIVYMYHGFLIHSSADGLLPCPGYYKQCCDEHWGAHVSFRSGFLSVYAQKWDCWVIWQFYFQFAFIFFKLKPSENITTYYNSYMKRMGHTKYLEMRRNWHPHLLIMRI